MKNAKTDYLAQFKNVGALLEGHFLLSSGLHSPRYLQCALVLQYPKITERMCAALAERVGSLKIDVVLAPALGGIVLGYELARALGARGIFAERQDNRMTLRRGFKIEPGERVVIAEDVITTGGSVRELIRIAQDAGAEVVAVAAMVDRSGGADLGAAVESLVQLDIPTYPADACPLCKQGLPLVKPGSRKKPGE